MTEFVHYSREPLALEALHSCKQDGRPNSIKPHGLWLSVEGEGSHGWRKWCEGEQWGLANLVYRHVVTLAPDASVLTLDATRDILDFSKRFVAVQAGYPPDLRDTTMFLNWPSVANEYAGLIIAPYNWSLRLDDRTSWYYGWDCASGCIWDHRAIANITTGEKL